MLTAFCIVRLPTARCVSKQRFGGTSPLPEGETMAITSLQERSIKAQEVKKERPSYWGPLMNMAKIVAQKKMSEEQLRVHTISTIQGIEASDAVRIIDILEHTCSNFAEMDMLGAREAYLYYRK